MTAGVQVRPYRTSDEEAVRSLFRATLAGGRPAPFDPAHPVMTAYEDLCVGWYLADGADWASVVVGDDDVPTGYALVCCDERKARAHTRRHARTFLFAAGRAGVRGRLDRDVATFVRLRVRDAATLVRSDRHRVPPVHAHLNLTGSARNTSAVLSVREQIDETVRRAGHQAWAGEINTRRGRRAGALGRSGFDVVGREPNHTLSWLTGEPVERLTVVRRLA